MTEYAFLKTHYSSASKDICIKCKPICITLLFNNLQTFLLDSVGNPNFLEHYAKYLMIVSALIFSCLPSAPTSAHFPSATLNTLLFILGVVTNVRCPCCSFYQRELFQSSTRWIFSGYLLFLLSRLISMKPFLKCLDF